MEVLPRRVQTDDRQVESSTDPGGLHQRMAGQLCRQIEGLNGCFRFLDLPPEMRNLIYGFLLTLSSRPKPSPSSCFGSCHPGILSTCRQIYNEAAGLLADPVNTEQPFNIMLHADWVKSPGRLNEYQRDSMELVKTVQIQNHGIYRVGNTKFEHLPTGKHAYPSFLRQVKRLHIEMNISVDEEEYYYGSPFVGSAAFARACIHTLVSFLMDGHSLQELKVTLNATKIECLRRHPSMVNPFWPLQRLRSIDVVNFVGFMDGFAITPALWESTIEKMRSNADQTPINALSIMQEVYHLCGSIVKRDDDNDERLAEHELLKIFYRYIMWELNFEGSKSLHFRLPEHRIAEHLSWMKRHIARMKERDKAASADQTSNSEQTNPSARHYWEVLGETSTRTPWSSFRLDFRTQWRDYKLMEASCGPQQEAVLRVLRKGLQATTFVPHTR